MEVLIKKWGNSLGVRIPNTIVRELHLKDGSPVEIEDNNGNIIISPKKYNLRDMLAQIDRTNIHAEYNTGSVEGKEAW
jgi:antitoxin MazE